jgi:hypothetical protein
MKRSSSRVHSLGLAGALLAAPFLAGCEEDPATAEYYCSLGSDSLPTTGTTELDYDGFVGTAPRSGMELYVSLEQAERVYLEGCVDSGEDLWWLDLDVELAVTAEQPASFELLDPDAGRVTALISRCPGGDCSQSRRAYFGGNPAEILVEGTLRQFDPVGGRLNLSATLVDIAERTLETSPLGITTNLSWEPSYVPILKAPVDGRWVVTTTQVVAGSADVTRHFELTQDGPAISGQLCSEDWECEDAELSGAVADPRVRLRWIEPTASGAVAYQLQASFATSGDEFSGALTNDAGDVSWIEGKRE